MSRKATDVPSLSKGYYQPSKEGQKLVAPPFQLMGKKNAFSIGLRGCRSWLELLDVCFKDENNFK